jgi:four helix bundle protein
MNGSAIDPTGPANGAAIPRGSANRSFRDLDVYQRLTELHLVVHRLSLTFPSFEKFELGSQMRRSSNSAPANVAEGWGNDHYRMYLLGVHRAVGEIQETQHHLHVAFRKEYLKAEQYYDLHERYEECRRMLRGLARRLKETNQ